VSLKRFDSGEAGSRATVAEATKSSGNLHHAGKTRAWCIGFVLGLVVTILFGSGLLQMRQGQFYIEESSIAGIQNAIRSGHTTARMWCAPALPKPEPITVACTAFLTKDGAPIPFLDRSLSSRSYISSTPTIRPRVTAFSPVKTPALGSSAQSEKAHAN